MIEKITLNEPLHEPLEKKRRKPRLRANHHLMEPEELTPDERWDRIVELLALMSMPEAPAAPDLKEVLMSESSHET